MPKAKARVFTPQEVEKIQTLSGLGLTIESIAALVDTSKATFDRTIKRTPGGPEALLKGRAMANAKVSQTAYQMATSGKHPVMTIFYLKCRAGWKPPVSDETEERGFEFTSG